MKDFIKAITTIAFDTATLTGGYDPIAAGGIPEACQIIRVINDSDVAVGLSYDGITTHEIIWTGASIQLYFQSNSRPNNKIACLAKRSNVCLIGAAGNGNVYFVGYYQET